MHLLNKSFTDATQLKLTTVANNASLLAYLGATPDAQPNGKGVEVIIHRKRCFYEEPCEDKS